KLGERDDERIVALEAALAAIGEGHTAERALLLATLSGELEYASTLEVRADLMDEAVAIAREVGDPWVLGTVLNRSGVTSAVPQNLEARRAASAESLAIAESLGDLTLEFWARCGGFQAALGGGDINTAETMQGILADLADEIGRPSFRWLASVFECTYLSAIGDTGRLEEQA
ncbi:unnamed protein product, partial [marine sediment metagenome]